jgi:phage baseplate assembly protein gpV
MSQLENTVFQLVQRFLAERYNERHALVTAYDPDKHLAKVTFQPEGHESGWMPIETNHIGSTYGIAIGLQPGSGAGNQQQQQPTQSQQGGNQQAIGDQVVVRFQEGDFEAGKIVGRVHSELDKPPTVQAGEIKVYAKFKQDQDSGPDAQQSGGGGQGCSIYFKNDGSMTLTDGNGATTVYDGKGNITVTCKKFTMNASDNIKLISTAAALIKGANAILYGTASAFIKAVSGAINAKAPANKVDPDWTNGASDPPISS